MHAPCAYLLHAAADTESSLPRAAGLWRLEYTTALDVAPILSLERTFPGPAFLAPKVGNIYQKFSDVSDGRVQNIIKLSVPFLLEERDGITLTVGR